MSDLPIYYSIMDIKVRINILHYIDKHNIVVIMFICNDIVFQNKFVQ